MTADLPFRVKNLAVLLLSLFILYLAGFYFGGLFMVLFYLALCLPLLSLTLCLFSLLGLRFHQDFDNEHPVKGQEIRYRLTLSNEGILPVARLRCRFKLIHRHMNLNIPSLSVYLKAGGKKTESHTFRCRCRGIYTVGLEGIDIVDPLGILTVFPSVHHRTFYVYPRVLRIPRLPLDIRNWEGGGTGVAQGGEPDSSLYTRLKPYRPGESVRHMHWKKFALTGKPYLLEYETRGKPEIGLYLDTRPCFPRFDPEGEGLRSRDSRDSGPDAAGIPTSASIEQAVLETEDTSVEILVALVKYFLDLRVPLTVQAAGREVYRFSGTEPSQFEEFYRSTINIMFDAQVGPDRLFATEELAASPASRTTIFITHLMDPSLFALVEDSLAGDAPFILIYNQVGDSRAGIRRNALSFNRLREKGARVLAVESPETIIDDLGGG